MRVSGYWIAYQLYDNLVAIQALRIGHPATTQALISESQAARWGMR